MNVRRTLLSLMALTLLASPLSAQSDDELRAKELIAKIQKEMAKIDEMLLQVDSNPAQAKEALEEVSKNIDELLNQVHQKQNGVIENIEELVKLTKYRQSQNSQSQGDSKQKEQKQGQKNQERQRDREVDDLMKQGQKQPKPKPEGEQPQDSQAQDTPGEQTDEGQQPPPTETGLHEQKDVSGRWGNLPAKEAELLQNLSKDQFPEKYLKLLEQYYRRANEKN